jgi:hypothetical protein
VEHSPAPFAVLPASITGRSGQTTRLRQAGPPSVRSSGASGTTTASILQTGTGQLLCSPKSPRTFDWRAFASIRANPDASPPARCKAGTLRVKGPHGGSPNSGRAMVGTGQERVGRRGLLRAVYESQRGCPRWRGPLCRTRHVSRGARHLRPLRVGCRARTMHRSHSIPVAAPLTQPFRRKLGPATGSRNCRGSRQHGGVSRDAD